eukprot:Hpha_TRINITY_DN15398_c0_g3::TRINITY_DN15398_c0_g3_i1::g.88572::m.88572
MRVKGGKKEGTQVSRGGKHRSKCCTTLLISLLVLGGRVSGWVGGDNSVGITTYGCRRKRHADSCGEGGGGRERGMGGGEGRNEIDCRDGASLLHQAGRSSSSPSVQSLLPPSSSP